MMTEILLPNQIDRAAEFLKQGEVVAFPTETVYGLGACIFNEKAVHKIFAAKGRPADNPLIAHISDFKDLGRIAGKLSFDALLLIDAFFPGPLTLILPRHPDVPDIVSAGLPTIAVRMPALPLARELIAAAGAPLVAPSANLSGRPSATEAKHVLEDLNGKIAAILDGGSCSLGIESTVVNLSGDQPVILRPGTITPFQISAVLKKHVPVYDKKIEGAAPSPGMKYRHYAPKARVKLFTNDAQLMRYVKNGLPMKRAKLTNVTSKDLYRVLRDADTQGCEEILILCDDAMHQDLALINRLTRAAEANELNRNT